MTVPFDPFDPELVRDPYPSHAALRQEEPVKRFKIGLRRGLGMAVSVVRALARRGMLNPAATLRFLRARRR